MKSAVVCLHRRFRSTYCDAIGLNVAVLLLSYCAVPPILSSNGNMFSYITYYLDQWILEYFLFNHLR